jgi:hypothetical protein
MFLLICLTYSYLELNLDETWLAALIHQGGKFCSAAFRGRLAVIFSLAMAKTHELNLPALELFVYIVSSCSQ